MAKKADIGSKRLISLAPETWVTWVTQQPDLTVTEFLTSDFQWISRENDVLIKVRSPDQGEFLVLNELQLRYDKHMPLRIRAYVALAEERYHLPVYPVLINILPPGKTPQIPSTYRSEFMGIEASQDYRVINLWEVDVELVFRDNLSTLLPFVPILKGGNEPQQVQQALIQLRANEQLQELEPLLSFFASFVLDASVIQEIMRWDMAVLRESPWYQEILKEGLQQGLQQGKIELVENLLTEQFGVLPFETRQRVENLSSEQLNALAKHYLTLNSIEELERWCDDQTPAS